MEAETLGIEEQPAVVDMECNVGSVVFGANPTDKSLKDAVLRALKWDRRITNQSTKPSTTLVLASLDRKGIRIIRTAGEIGNQYKKTPTMFVKGVLGMDWKLRCKWWLDRHFSKKLLVSEMAGGNLTLMAYKAACASQIYGPGFSYVVFWRKEKTLSF